MMTAQSSIPGKVIEHNPPPPEDPPFDLTSEGPDNVPATGTPPPPEPPPDQLDLFPAITNHAVKSMGAIATEFVPGEVSKPAPAPAVEGEWAGKTEFTTVLHKVRQRDPDTADPTESHWVSVKATVPGYGERAVQGLEETLEAMYKRGYAIRGAPVMPSSGAFGQPQTFAAPSVSPGAVPNAPAATSTVAPNPVSPPQPGSNIAPQGSGESGVDKLHEIQVNVDGKVEFLVGAFKWPFKDSRYMATAKSPAGVFARVFDPALNFTLEHLQKPAKIDLRASNVVVEWSKNGKYYNVDKVRFG